VVWPDAGSLKETEQWFREFWSERLQSLKRFLEEESRKPGFTKDEGDERRAQSQPDSPQGFPFFTILVPLALPESSHGGFMTTATYSAVAAPIATIFAINDDLALRALDGLTHRQLWEAPTGRNNAMLWVAGHIVQTRAQLLTLLGEPFDTGWGALFNRGAMIGDANGYPSRQEIERVMRDVSQRLQAKLAALDDQQLAQPPSMDAPGVRTVADQVAGFAFHDSYHVGQMGYIRKALGYPALAG
jgi:hypothetical protein